MSKSFFLERLSDANCNHGNAPINASVGISHPDDIHGIPVQFSLLQQVASQEDPLGFMAEQECCNCNTCFGIPEGAVAQLIRGEDTPDGQEVFVVYQNPAEDEVVFFGGAATKEYKDPSMYRRRTLRGSREDFLNMLAIVEKFQL